MAAAEKLDPRIEEAARSLGAGPLRVVGVVIVPALTPDLVEVYRHDWAYRSDGAARELGYAPRSLADGFTDTFAWLRASALLP